MEKRKYYFKSCTSTAGKPFEDGPKCPLYLKTNEYLRSQGWTQVFYNSFKTGKGDLCNTKYRRLGCPEGSTSEILGMMEISIEGTKDSCTLTAVLWTYHPKNILRTIDHGCEIDVIKQLDYFFEPLVLKDTKNG